MIRVVLPQHLRTLAGVDREVALDVPPGPVTQRTVLDAVEAHYPMLRGTIRDHATQLRRPLVRFFACEEDLSNESPDAPLPEKVASGAEAFYIIGAIAGGSAPAPPATPVTGVVEAVLYVSDLPRAVAFYRDLFGFEEELRADLICVLRVPGRQALILFPHAIADAPVITPPIATEGTIPPHGGRGRMHVAFGIPSDALDAWRQRLASRNVRTEAVVRWKRGGTSLFFRDPDEHLVELITPGLWSFY